MRAALVIAFTTMVMPVAAQAPLTESQQERCAAEGGCVTMTRAALVKGLRSGYESGLADGAAIGLEAGKRTCWRPS